MSTKNLNFELKSRVRRYLEYKMKNESNYDVDACNKILLKLSKKLRDEVILEGFSKYAENIPFFKKNFSQKTLEKLAFSLKEINFSPEEIIYRVTTSLKLCFT